MVMVECNVNWNVHTGKNLSKNKAIATGFFSLSNLILYINVQHCIVYRILIGHFPSDDRDDDDVDDDQPPTFRIHHTKQNSSWVRFIHFYILDFIQFEWKREETKAALLFCFSRFKICRIFYTPIHLYIYICMYAKMCSCIFYCQKY